MTVGDAQVTETDDAAVSRCRVERARGDEDVAASAEIREQPRGHGHDATTRWDEVDLRSDVRGNVGMEATWIGVAPGEDPLDEGIAATVKVADHDKEVARPTASGLAAAICRSAEW